MGREEAEKGAPTGQRQGSKPRVRGGGGEGAGAPESPRLGPEERNTGGEPPWVPFRGRIRRGGGACRLPGAPGLELGLGLRTLAAADAFFRKGCWRGKGQPGSGCSLGLGLLPLSVWVRASLATRVGAGRVVAFGSRKTAQLGAIPELCPLDGSWGCWGFHEHWWSPEGAVPPAPTPPPRLKGSVSLAGRASGMHRGSVSPSNWGLTVAQRSA